MALKMLRKIGLRAIYPQASVLPADRSRRAGVASDQAAALRRWSILRSVLITSLMIFFTLPIEWP